MFFLPIATIGRAHKIKHRDTGCGITSDTPFGWGPAGYATRERVGELYETF